MVESSEIKCDLCGKQIKTYSKTEMEYYEYEYSEVVRFYPLPEENAHLVRNYICNDCYNNIGDIVVSRFIENGKQFTGGLELRKQKAYEDYQNELRKLEERNQYVHTICEILKSAESILDLKEDVIKNLNTNFPYTLGSTFYLDSAIDIEKRTKQGKKNIYEWEEELLINIESVPTPYKKSDFVTKDTLKEILPECKIKDKTFKEMSEIIRTL